MALNAILLDFKDKGIGALQGCAEGDETLYTINDPFIIESERLSTIVDKSTVSKPDICKIPLERLLHAAEPEGLKDDTLKGLATFMENQENKWKDAWKNSKSKIKWAHVVHCLEVKSNSKKALTTAPPRFLQPYETSVMFASGEVTQPLRCELLIQS